MNDVHPTGGYDAATAGEPHSGRYQLLGEKTGHGDVGWTPVDRAELGDPPAWRTASRRAVVALLDSGVRRHPWLPVGDGQDFLVEAPGWEQACPREVPKLADLDGEENFGSHLGHATFIAGIIRRIAPDAQVLSVKVMDDQGRVDEENVVAALEWLATYHDTGGTVDVALMAFGRRIANGDDTSGLAERTKKAIDDLAGRGVQVVISAGNSRSDEAIFPASYARVAGHAAGTVASVGAGLSPEFPEEYSSRGPWVTDWRLGGEVISIVPLTPVVDGEPPSASAGEGFAKWSGTSFAAAIFAGECAARVETIG